MDDTPLAPQTFAARRLHPATIFIELMRRLGSFAYVIAIAVIARVAGGGDTDWPEYVVSAAVLLGVGGAVLRYVSLRYGIEGDRLVIRSGIVFRQVRTIPIARIQNIDLKRGVLHQVFSVVDVSIETAGGAKPEGQLSALSEPAAEELRRELMRRRDAAGGVEAQPAPPAPWACVWRSSLGDLLIAGATENRVGLIVGAAVGVYYTFSEAVLGGLPILAESIFRLRDTGWYMTAVLAVIGVVLLILAGWLVSIVMTVTRFYGFSLWQNEDRLRRHYGLITKFETVLPLQRVQIVRLESPLLRRLLGCYAMHAETAGSAVDQKRGGSSPLCPLISSGDVGRLCRVIFPQLDYDAAQWQHVSPLTIRRGFIRYALVGTAGVVLLAAWAGWSWLWAWPAVAAVAAFCAWVRYRTLGYASVDGFLLARAGLWTRRVWIIPHAKIQSLSMPQSPFQRRLRLASLEVFTAGAPSLTHARIVDLPVQIARSLQDRLSREANTAGLWLLDGV